MQCFYVWKDIPCVLTSLTQGEQNYDSWGLVAPRMSKTEQKKLVKKLTHRHMPQAYATHAHATQVHLQTHQTYVHVQLYTHMGTRTNTDRHSNKTHTTHTHTSGTASCSPLPRVVFNPCLLVCMATRAALRTGAPILTLSIVAAVIRFLSCVRGVT
jgi:hypothetical protein